ncbi:OmpA family protein [Desulfobacula phenolica]|uniref:Outer membrane protein OmpA n=1 Tax=Desulfobacula phenolica TaxID=90732 RepID=A0A1H2JVV1_9BACT|nr:OmpA family protein [Desulfobacula phenolica]SDU60215.1 Outer membrane protein OmpA [Desulfobacula phenolica]
MYRQLGIFLFTLTLLAACSAKKDLFVLMPDPGGKVGAITLYNNVGEVKLTKAFESVRFAKAKAPKVPVVISAEEVNKTFNEALEVLPQAPDKYILYFISGTTTLTQESKNKLPDILKNIKKRIPCDVSVIGHSDTKGNYKNNLKLSWQRAVKVKEELLAIGVYPELIEVASHGEAAPLVPTGDNVSEPQNRRVEVSVR